MTSLFRPVIFAALVAAALVADGRADAQPTGRCVTVELPGSVDAIELPDGSIAVDESIRLCFSRRLSPVAGLHETSVGATPIGMFVSRLEPIEAEIGPPYVSLARTARGRWRLEGYAVPTSRGMVAFHLQPAPGGRERDPAALSASTTSLHTFVTAAFTR